VYLVSRRLATIFRNFVCLSHFLNEKMCFVAKTTDVARDAPYNQDNKQTFGGYTHD